jgi:glycosyltransferase involved in cell wall biosynthesis
VVATDRREGVRLSVIIPCLDAGDEITAQLDGLAEETWSEPWEVVVADNGSTDGTREIVSRYRELPQPPVDRRVRPARRLLRPERGRGGRPR